MKNKLLRRTFLISFLTTSLSGFAQMSIGTPTPDASAILELNVNNLESGNKKGFLAPRLALNSRLDTSTIPSPAIGLLVYNLGPGNDFSYKGYVFWDGEEWRALSGSSLAEGTIGEITCNAITLIPSRYEKGKPFEGVMNVPYTGGNGGVFPAQTIGPVNGLTATLAAGSFTNGAGTLSYTITGTPTISTPETTIFTIEIGGKNCDAVIGADDGIALGDLVYYQTPPILASIYGNGGALAGGEAKGWMSYYADDLPLLGGKIRLDGYFNATSNTAGGVSFNPRLVNVSEKPVKIWFSAMTTIDSFRSGNHLLAADGGWVNLDNGIYYGYGANDVLGVSTPRVSGNGVNGQEIVQVDLSLDDKWYRIYYFPIVDNLNTTDNADNVRKIFLSIQRLY
jgi:hypothetical protein